MPRLIDNVEHWRQRAEKARAIADLLTDPVAKLMMRGTAEAYDGLADDAERREMAARKGKASPS
jgi:hypothetical protein